MLEEVGIAVFFSAGTNTGCGLAAGELPNMRLK
jgi:hypothetical protein